MRIFFLLTFIASLSACGIKGKPLPPLPEEPLVTSDEKSDAASQPAKVQPLKTLPSKKKKSK